MSRHAGLPALVFVLALWARVAFAGDPSAEKPGELKPPIVKCTGATQAEGYIAASFEVTNPNEVPLPYVGYTSDSFSGGLKEGTIAPLYRIELKKQEQWNKHDVGFCGTGIGPVTLPAKSKVTYEAVLPIEDWNAAKVGLTWWDPADDETKVIVAWSSDVNRQEAVKKPSEGN